MILLLAGLTACNKLLDVPPPPNEIVTDKVFKDSASAITALSSIYGGMVTHPQFEWSGLSFFAARSADEAETDYINEVDFFARDSVPYDYYEVVEAWMQGFSSLLMINTCIKGLQSSNSLSAALHSQLLGESLFSRAFVNFYLVNLWGDAIPLITDPDVHLNQLAKSVPRQRVYDQIVADLLRAQGLLTPAYPSEGRVRPNLMAADALLARVYLYMGRYSDAITQASTVINSNLYTPLPAVDATFLQSSREAIWQLIPPVDENKVRQPVGDVLVYRGSSASLTPQLLAAFEPDDLRRQSWVADNEMDDTVYTTANKYKSYNDDPVNTPDEYYIVLRLAEQYLVRAEAGVRLGQIGAAVADLNVVRARAGLPALPADLTPSECMAAVEQERRVELFTEWGHRWLDLRRWPGITNPNLTRADEVLGAIKPDWQPTDKWYPVPQQELQINPFLVQNPGYPTQ